MFPAAFPPRPLPFHPFALVFQGLAAPFHVFTETRVIAVWNVGRGCGVLGANRDRRQKR